jgi:glycerol-3-phosphate dehydrogenase
VPPPPPRATSLRRLADETFDVLVVGAGSTGAAVARDAALRGLRVALCDRGDIAGETSSHSSKLIHGGIRYLENGHLHLVFEALTERRRLMAAAPHLCRPVEFILPVWRHQDPSLLKLSVGVALYDALALFRKPVHSRRLSARALNDLVPDLRHDGLKGAIGYVDCQTDDSRLVLETALDAEAAGAVLATYVQVITPPPARRGHLHVVHAFDRAAHPDGHAPADEFTITARAVVNATGPFSDAFRGDGPVLRPTLGVHIVVPAERLATTGRAFVLRAPQDGRIMFVLPAGTRTIVGTTDTDWPQRPAPGDAIEASAADVEYLLESIAHNFPGAQLGPADVLSTYAGLRPLLASDDASPSATSREHAIWVDRRGLLSVAGGKLTTMRRMGEDVVDRLVELLATRGFDAPIGPCLTRTRPLPGGAGGAQLGPTTNPHELAADVEAHLAASFGARARQVLDLLPDQIDGDEAAATASARRLVNDLPYLAVEIAFAIQREHALEVEDVLCRRVPLFRLDRDQGLATAALTADMLAAAHGWSPSRRAASLASYQRKVAGSRRWRQSR